MFFCVTVFSDSVLLVQMLQELTRIYPFNFVFESEVKGISNTIKSVVL